MNQIFRGIAAYAMAATLSLGLALPAFADTSDVATSEDYGHRVTVETTEMTPIEGSEVADGTYDIVVETDSSMFNITDCVLTVEDGKMSAVVTLSGNGYEYLFEGTGEEAAAADESDYIEYVKDESDDYTYAISNVEALNQEISVCSYSKRREKWYDHTIIFLAGTLPSSALSEEAQQAVKEASPVHDLDDGDYTIAVDMSGGTDTLTSPAAMTMLDGEATVTLEWSSDSYQSMTIAGEEYDPINTSGNSVFEMPITVFDTSVPVTIVKADGSSFTGSLSFHSGRITSLSETTSEEAAQTTTDSSSSTGLSTGTIVGILIVVVAVIAIVVVAVRRKKKK